MKKYTKEEQLKLIETNWENLKDIDNQYADVCIMAIKKDIKAIQYVKKLTKRIISIAMKKNPHFIRYVKVEDQTEEMCLEAVKNNGLTLYYVKDKTEEICLEAVKCTGRALRYVKEQTEEICLEAVKQDGLALGYVKEQTEKICLEAIKNNVNALQYVKEQTPKICLEAVKIDGNKLEHVKYQTEEICIAAIKEHKYKHAIKYVREQTPKICLESVKKNPDTLQYVKDQTEEICIEAVKEHSSAIKYVKEITPKIYFFAFLNDNSIFCEYKDEIDNLIKNNFNIENNTFCIKIYYKYRKDKNYSYFNMNTFLFMKDLLIHKNINNTYIFKDTIDIELLKEIALSNNELILVDEGNIKPIHKKLANKIITIEDLEKGSF